MFDTDLSSKSNTLLQFSFMKTSFLLNADCKC